MTYDMQEKAEPKKKKKFKVTMVILFFALMISHFAKWEKYAYEVVPLKVMSLTSSASEKDLNRLVFICNYLKNLGCLESAYGELVKVSPKNNDYLLAFARAQVKNQNPKEAKVSYARFFKGGGQGLEPIYEFANVLGELKMAKFSEYYFEQGLKRDKSKLPAESMRQYIKMLTADKQYAKAKKLIFKFRRRSKKAAFFMKKELTAINEAIESKSGRMLASTKKKLRK